MWPKPNIVSVQCNAIMHPTQIQPAHHPYQPVHHIRI
ncbi:hypothetical protein F383_14947 [Gossypium arboreum]|uniref:Uncharacterized protein n=1 Tax=Gossypium arboreum TaxID=29729 RepID=A0A0B0Q0Z5_GOSAR|nr:hypothetical protein F383_14947 [Gossypium arboreum]